MFSGRSVPRSSNVTRGASPQVRARCERAQLQRREESPPARWRAHGRARHEVPVPDDHRYLTQNQQKSTPVGWLAARSCATRSPTGTRSGEGSCFRRRGWCRKQLRGRRPLLRDREGQDLMVSGGASQLTAARTLSGPPDVLLGMSW